MVDGELLSDSNIVCLSLCGIISSEHGADIRLHSVIYIGEITCLLSVAINADRLALHNTINEYGYHRSIGATRVLSRAEHVEITKPDHLHAELAEEYPRIQFVCHFSDGVWGQLIPSLGFYLGQPRFIAIY